MLITQTLALYKTTLHMKIYSQHNFPILQLYRAVLPNQPEHEKITFDFLLRNSEFYFLSSAIPHGFLFSVCLLTKPQNSPADSEKQTAVVCKDKGIFLWQSLCSVKNLPCSSRPRPFHHCLLRSQRCMFSVSDIATGTPTRPTKHVQALNGYVQKNLKKNKRPQRPLPAPHQVRQRKPQKMLSNWQLRRSLQAYNR